MDDVPQVLRMRAVGQSEMRQLLSTLNVHCISAPVETGKRATVEKSKQTLKVVPPPLPISILRTTTSLIFFPLRPLPCPCSAAVC